jgi:Arc/MetJ-type ribon-helix-helix transcriptional regulator
MTKRRITVTIDEDVYETAVEAVEAGRSPSVSAWVNATLSDRQAHERRMNALAELVADYERESGRTITAEDVAATEERDREAAAAVRAGRAERHRRAG